MAISHRQVGRSATIEGVIQSWIYLDHAATTPIDPLVLEAMKPYFSNLFFNPSSPYSPAAEVKADYRRAKSKIAKVLGVVSDELVMTAGATESINLAFKAATGKSLISSIEHASVAKAAARSSSLVVVGVNKKGLIDLEQFRREITGGVSFVSVALANHELGIIQPLAEMAEIIRQERDRRLQVDDQTPLIFHSDASQGPVLLDIKPRRLGVDLLTINASKVYGPKQVGLLWVRPGVKLQPEIVGGGQESGLRSGTENVAGVIGFAVALELAAKRRNSELARLRRLRSKLQSDLVAAFPWAVVSSDSKRSLANYLNISFPGIDAERLVYLLEKERILVATGSACAANRGNRSTVLQAIGLNEAEIDGSLRLTLGGLNTDDNIDQASAAIIAAVKLEKERLR